MKRVALMFLCSFVLCDEDVQTYDCQRRYGYAPTPGMPYVQMILRVSRFLGGRIVSSCVCHCVGTVVCSLAHH